MQAFLLNFGIYLLRKVRFKKWSKLEDKKYNCIQAVEDGASDFPELLYAYLSTALFFPVNFSKISWKDSIDALYKVHKSTSEIKKIPITSYQENKKEEKESWEYSGRLWFFYCHLIASAYGWSAKKIARLSVDDALAHIQEILTAQYLDREFIWSTSEIAYPYNKATKKSNYSPLPKPYWMRREKSIRKAPVIPKSLLPIGNVINLYDPKKLKLK